MSALRHRVHPRLHPWLRALETGRPLPSSPLLLDKLSYAILGRLTKASSGVSAGELLHFLTELYSVPFPVPAFFFTGQATTSIQLSTQPRWNGTDPLWMMDENQLVLKFEGIIQRTAGRARRKIRKVRLGVRVTDPIRQDAYPNNLAYNRVINEDLADKMAFTASTYPSHSSVAAGGESVTGPAPPSLVFDGVLKGRYFTSTALLDLDLVTGRASGHKVSFFSINVHVVVEDESGREWHTGPDLSIPIQIFEKRR